MLRFGAVHPYHISMFENYGKNGAIHPRYSMAIHPAFLKRFTKDARKYYFPGWLLSGAASDYEIYIFDTKTNTEMPDDVRNKVLAAGIKDAAFSIHHKPSGYTVNTSVNRSLWDTHYFTDREEMMSFCEGFMKDVINGTAKSTAAIHPWLTRKTAVHPYFLGELVREKSILDDSELKTFNAGVCIDCGGQVMPSPLGQLFKNNIVPLDVSWEYRSDDLEGQVEWDGSVERECVTCHSKYYERWYGWSSVRDATYIDEVEFGHVIRERSKVYASEGNTYLLAPYTGLPSYAPSLVGDVKGMRVQVVGQKEAEARQDRRVAYWTAVLPRVLSLTLGHPLGLVKFSKRTGWFGKDKDGTPIPLPVRNIGGRPIVLESSSDIEDFMSRSGKFSKGPYDKGLVTLFFVPNVSGKALRHIIWDFDIADTPEEEVRPKVVAVAEEMERMGLATLPVFTGSSWHLWCKRPDDGVIGDYGGIHESHGVVAEYIKPVCEKLGIPMRGALGHVPGQFTVDYQVNKANSPVRFPLSLHHKTGLVALPLEKKEVPGLNKYVDAHPETVMGSIDKYLDRMKEFFSFLGKEYAAVHPDFLSKVPAERESAREFAESEAVKGGWVKDDSLDDIWAEAYFDEELDGEEGPAWLVRMVEKDEDGHIITSGFPSYGPGITGKGRSCGPSGYIGHSEIECEEIAKLWNLIQHGVPDIPEDMWSGPRSTAAVHPAFLSKVPENLSGTWGRRVVGYDPKGKRYVTVEVNAPSEDRASYFSVSAEYGSVDTQKRFQDLVDEWWEMADLEGEFGHLADEMHLFGEERKKYLERIADELRSTNYPYELDYDGDAYAFMTEGGGQAIEELKGVPAVGGQEECKAVIEDAWEKYHLKHAVPADVLITLKECFDSFPTYSRFEDVLIFGRTAVHLVSPLVLDIRTKKEFGTGHIKGAKLVETPLPPLDDKAVERLEKELALAVKGHPKGMPIEVYCKKGIRAGVAANILEKLGYMNIKVLGGVESDPELRERFSTAIHPWQLQEGPRVARKVGCEELRVGDLVHCLRLNVHWYGVVVSIEKQGTVDVRWGTTRTEDEVMAHWQATPEKALEAFLDHGHFAPTWIRCKYSDGEKVLWDVISSGHVRKFGAVHPEHLKRMKPAIGRTHCACAACGNDILDDEECTSCDAAGCGTIYCYDCSDNLREVGHGLQFCPECYDRFDYKHCSAIHPEHLKKNIRSEAYLPYTFSEWTDAELIHHGKNYHELYYKTAPYFHDDWERRENNYYGVVEELRKRGYYVPDKKSQWIARRRKSDIRSGAIHPALLRDSGKKQVCECLNWDEELRFEGYLVRCSVCEAQHDPGTCECWEFCGRCHSIVCDACVAAVRPFDQGICPYCGEDMSTSTAIHPLYLLKPPLPGDFVLAVNSDDSLIEGSFGVILGDEGVFCDEYEVLFNPSPAPWWSAKGYINSSGGPSRMVKASDLEYQRRMKGLFQCWSSFVHDGKIYEEVGQGRATWVEKEINLWYLDFKKAGGGGRNLAL